MHAEKGRLEAGFNDPALGWIGVRAEAGPSGIHASVVPGSTIAEESVRAHLPGLSSYLAEHRTPVETLTVAASAGHSTAQWSGGANGHQTGQQGRQDAQHAGAGSNRSTAAHSNASSPVTNDATEGQAHGSAAPWGAFSSSRSISVIA